VISGFFKPTLPPMELPVHGTRFPGFVRVVFHVVVPSSHHLSRVCYLSLAFLSQRIRNVQLLSRRATQNSWVFTEKHQSRCVSCMWGSSRIFYC